MKLDWLTVRIDSELKEKLRKVAQARRCDMGDIVRLLIAEELARLSYLSPEEKKALGLHSNEA
jgi:predicted transcriptional regulator